MFKKTEQSYVSKKPELDVEFLGDTEEYVGNENQVTEERDLKRKKSHIDACLIRLLAETKQALAIFGNFYFIKLKGTLNKAYKMPCRQTCTKNIFKF